MLEEYWNFQYKGEEMMWFKTCAYCEKLIWVNSINLVCSNKTHNDYFAHMNCVETFRGSSTQKLKIRCICGRFISWTGIQS